MTNKFSRKAGLTAVAIALLGFTVSAAAQDNSAFVRNTDASGRTCFRADRVEGFAATRFSDDHDGVNLRVRNEVYQMKFATPCPTIRDATRIALDSREPVYVCNGADADIVTYSGIQSPQRCRVIGLRKIEPAEVASLPANEKP